MSIKARLSALEDRLQVEEGAGPEGGGLAALLQYAAQRGLQALPAVEEDDLPTTGLGALLREARAWRRAQAAQARQESSEPHDI